MKTDFHTPSSNSCKRSGTKREKKLAPNLERKVEKALYNKLKMSPAAHKNSITYSCRSVGLILEAAFNL
jgi:hypothetical protein